MSVPPFHLASYCLWRDMEFQWLHMSHHTKWVTSFFYTFFCCFLYLQVTADEENVSFTHSHALHVMCNALESQPHINSNAFQAFLLFLMATSYDLVQTTDCTSSHVSHIFQFTLILCTTFTILHVQTPSTQNFIHSILFSPLHFWHIYAFHQPLLAHSLHMSKLFQYTLFSSLSHTHITTSLSFSVIIYSTNLSLSLFTQPTFLYPHIVLKHIISNTVIFYTFSCIMPCFHTPSSIPIFALPNNDPSFHTFLNAPWTFFTSPTLWLLLPWFYLLPCPLSGI